MLPWYFMEQQISHSLSPTAHKHFRLSGCILFPQSWVFEAFCLRCECVSTLQLCTTGLWCITFKNNKIQSESVKNFDVWHDNASLQLPFFYFCWVFFFKPNIYSFSLVLVTCYFAATWHALTSISEGFKMFM